MTTGNDLMDALPASATKIHCPRWLVNLEQGHALVLQGRPMTHAFFPVTAVCSVAIELRGAGWVQTAIVGSEGCTGLQLALGTSFSRARETIAIAGSGYLLRAEELDIICREHGALRQAIWRHAGYRVLFAERLVACNAHHPVRERLACWLLVAHDRVAGREIPFTQEMLAGMVAARRPGVSIAAGELKRAGAIEYSRGVLRVLDRRKLRALACQCYDVMKAAPAVPLRSLPR